MELGDVMKAKIPYFVALIPIVLTVAFLMITVFLLDIPLFIPLLFGYFLTVLIAMIYHIKVQSLWIASISGIRSISMIIVILVLIGILIAIWSSSGTIDALVYYGLALIHPNYLVFISFIVSSLISMLLGTSVGTSSTVGVAFMGMAHHLGISPSLVAGALVSGAFVGDRTSPLSSAAQMNSLVTDTNYYENIKELLKTLIPAMMITSIFYLFIESGIDSIGGGADFVVGQARREIVSLYGTLSLWLLLPPLVIMILAFFKISTRLNLLAGILIGAVLAYIFQGRDVLELGQYALFGFNHPNGKLFGGGWNMFNQILLIVVAGAFYGVLDSSGILSIILDKMTKSMKNELSVVQKTMGISIASAALSSTQVMGIIIPGKVMSNIYKKMDMKLTLLNRMISDSGMMVAGLIPWNLNAILLGIALNISVLDYLPYAFLLVVLPIYSYLHYWWGFAKKEKTTGRKIAKNIE